MAPARTAPASIDVWSLNRRVTHRLMVWSVASIIGGIALFRSGKPLPRAVGVQFVVWGAVDGALALGGQQSAERKQAAATPADDLQQAKRLRGLLLVNCVFDLLYVAGGIMLPRTQPGDASRKGHALGIALQGSFLFVFDALHALRVPRLARH